MMEKALQTKTVVRQVTGEGKLLNQYLKIRSIGEGPYSKIKLMRNTQDGRLYAMKKYNLFILKKKNKLLRKEKGQVFYTSAADEVINEVSVLKLLHHPFVAELKEIIEDEQEEKIYLFLEYGASGEIATWSPKTEKFTINKHLTSPQLVKRAFSQLARVVSYLHASLVVHRDLKPQNVMLDGELNVKLIDFGRAVKLEHVEQRLRGSEGTYHFMAPEMLSEVFPEGYEGRRCDMWSLGVTFYAILFQTLPFYEQLLIKLFDKIEKCEYSLPEKYNQEYAVFVPLIQRLLRINPSERLTADELVAELEQL